MHWIPFVLLGLNLGGALAAGSSEPSGSRSDPIASINELIAKHQSNYKKQIELVEEQLRDEPNSEILRAFVALKPIASHMYRSDFDCDKNSVKESLARFASMRELLRPLFEDDLLNSRAKSPIPIVRSFSHMEKKFLSRCLAENWIQLCRSAEPWERELKIMSEFEARSTLPLEVRPLSEQARRVIEEDSYRKRLGPLPFYANGKVVGGAMKVDEYVMNFCEQSCGKIDGAFKGLYETGLELLEVATSIGFETKQSFWYKYSTFLDYLLCMAIRDNLATKLSSARESHSDTLKLDV